MFSGLKLVDAKEMEEPIAKDKKKSKKEKKDKKHKKDKRERRSRSRSSDSDASDRGGARDARPDIPSAPPKDSDAFDAAPSTTLDGAPADVPAGPARDSWMTSADGFSVLGGASTVGRLKAEQEAARRQTEAKEAAAKRAEEEKTRAGLVKEGANAAPPPARVGDGGASWRLKALQRAKERATEQGKGLADVVMERWTSLGDLTGQVMKDSGARGRGGDQDRDRDRGRDRDRDRTGGDRGREEGRKGAKDGYEYLGDVRSDRGQMRRPGDDVRTAWGGRRDAKPQDAAPAAAAAAARAEPGTTARPSTAREDAVADEDEEGRRLRQEREDMRRGRGAYSEDALRRSEAAFVRGEERAREESRRAFERAAASDDDMEEEEDDDDRDGRRDRQRRSDRQDRGRDTRDDRDSDRDRDRDRSGRRDARDAPRGAASDRPPPPRDSREAGGQERRGGGRAPRQTGPSAAETLASVAPHLNQFAGDGSFMEKFERMSGRGGAGGGEEEDRDREAGKARESEREGEEGGGHGRGRPRPGIGMGAGERGRSPPRAASAMAPPPSKPAAPPAPAGPVSNLGAAAALRARLLGKAPPTAAEIESANAAAAAARAAAAPPPRERRDPNEGKSAILSRTANRLENELGGGDANEVVELDEEADAGPQALQLIDARGVPVPGAFGRETVAQKAAADAAAYRGKKTERYGEEGKKARYFADDDRTDLKELVRRQRLGLEADVGATLERNIAKKKSFRNKELDVDEEYDNDAGLDLLEDRPKKRSKQSVEAAAQRERIRQVSDQRRLNTLLSGCEFCVDSPRRPRHLTVALGNHAYLRLPPRGRIVEGHCQIVLGEHVASTRLAEDHVHNEVRNFKKSLVRMFLDQGKEVVFLETVMGLDRQRGHGHVDCVPIPASLSDDCPMYFKKAIEESESEWAQHGSKALIDTRAKGIRGSVPPNFPYFHVEFGIGGGYAHVIDDEENFNDSLGRDTLITLMGLPPEDMYRSRDKGNSEAAQRQQVAAFLAQYEKYDWTKELM